MNQLYVPFAVSEKRVQRIMKSLGLRSIVIKKYRPYQADAVYNEGENVLKWDFSTTKKNEKRVSDITYLHTVADGWTYLGSMMDVATNKMIG
ncbi:hypothetical protein MM817_02897 [Acidibacillus sp. S0AB]|uniref:Integrase catalytic domain-containing protein n=1 Tax=Sulfoacidibacillus ferrooxidans TaxID=2005001 RepID=A0A9X2AEI3_9BACL|nr:hypothetical protein [Sulfoacidibacillus ferrooxidans]